MVLTYYTENITQTLGCGVRLGALGLPRFIERITIILDCLSASKSLRITEIVNIVVILYTVCKVER